MAAYYITSTAVGGGSGTSGDPFTLAEAVAIQSGAAMTDTFALAPGLYTTTAALTLSKGLWQADDPTNRPVIRRVSVSGGNHVVVNSEVRAERLVFDANGLANQHALLAGSRINSCHFFATTASAAALGECVNCEFGQVTAYHSAVSISDTSVLVRCVVRNHTTAAIRTLGVGVLSGCVVIGGQEAIRYDGGSAYITDCVFFNCTATMASVGGTISRSVCYRSGAAAGTALIGRGYELLSARGGLRVCSGVCVGGYAVAVGDNTYGAPTVAINASPFVDAANSDLRLTSAAKASGNANTLKHIMAGIVGTPGVTTDSYATLLGGSAGFTGVRGISGALGT
jgi:hypothetical protein